jgi:hypothetical protein
MYIYIYIYIYTYIYIYASSQGEPLEEIIDNIGVDTRAYNIYIYMYICIYVYTSTYIIFIYRGAPRRNNW